MEFNYKNLEIYSGLSDKEITAEMRRRTKAMPELIPKVRNGEQIQCVMCEQGYYVNKLTTFYCNFCGHQVILN